MRDEPQLRFPPTMTTIRVDTALDGDRDAENPEDGYITLTHDGSHVFISIDGKHETSMPYVAARCLGETLIAFARVVEGKP